MSLVNVIAGEKRIDSGVELRSVTIVGYMGSGKTTMAKHLIAKAHRELKKRGVKDKRILALHFYRANINIILDYLRENIDPSNLEYIYLINDDAVYQNISRRSLSSINVEDARQYVVIRHELEELGFDGVLIVFHLTQLYYLLDKVLRNSPVLIFKTISRDEEERRIVGRLLGKHYYRMLRQITDAILCGNKEQLNKAINLAIVVTGTKRHVYKFKKEEPSHKIYKEITPSEIKNFYNNRVKITCREVREVFRAYGVKCSNDTLTHVTRALNDIILAKMLGEKPNLELEQNDEIKEVKEWLTKCC